MTSTVPSATPASAADPAVPDRTVSPWAVLGVASIAAFMVFLDTQVLFVAFEDIRASFPDVSFATMSWTLSAYTIALAAALVPAGRLADRFGRRRTFLIGLVAFTIASALCAVAASPGLLVGFRVLQALGAAALVPASLAIVLSVFPREKVPAAVAIWGAIAALAAAVGPTAGALLVDAWGWQAVFLINLPIGAVALVLARRTMPESREAQTTRFPDPIGILLLAGALSLLALGIVQSDQWHWLSARTIGALVAGLVVLTVFVVRTLGHPHPALDLSLFGAASFRWANIATAAFTIGFTAMFFAQVLFLTNVWGYSIVRTGLVMMPGPVVVIVLAPLFGRLAGRIGQRAILVPGGLIYAASGLWLIAAMTTEPHWVEHLLPGALLGGLGVAMVIPHLTSAAVQGLPADAFGAGSAVNQAIRQFGATFGVALTVALLGTVTPLNALDHFQRVWWMLALCGVLTSLAALALPRPARATAPSTTAEIGDPA
ncbi:DHA2 family efflux MFS transporter permease subunit [Nocardioides marmoriginsengisoli]|uniref:DHA2 family efflux MFS transporter permease subunit n=1 Tax=Nocardioides marmoriginsengisoli TaxID=661483 RepID=A0A3N0CPX2_9ACTN|nr:DHA2 family efflux MFS transporter permease subunit [Nocardioides marmoriginsengisoli]RNL65420.1 DHA2 family efflux MFS transporter permease subunit [Nocardioides marmoriginsengisoli]